MTNNNVVLALIIIIPVLIGIGIISHISSEERTKIEAQKIIDFRNTDHSCNELVNLYLKIYPKRYDSFTNVQWKNEVRSELISTKCIDNEQLNNLEFIEICMDGGTVGCEISKLENPELYENFDFKTSIKETVSHNLESGSGKE